MPDNQRHPLMYSRMIAKIILDIGPECTQIGDPPGIGGLMVSFRQVAIPRGNFLLF